jgi:response regulator RpfG family c-di-GMP phosphodiesterase
MREKILFVDDEAQILKSLKRLFRDEPYEVLTMDNPHSALRMVEENEVAVVVSDQRMPEMEGSEFLEKVKALRPDTIRMIMTGCAGRETSSAAGNNGNVHRFLCKPWDSAELKSVVKEAVKEHRVSEEARRAGSSKMQT